MALTRYLPHGLRMRLGGALHNARVVRRSIWLPFRPTFQARHTPGELEALSQEWAARRAMWERQGILRRQLRAEVWDAEVCDVVRETEDAVTLVCQVASGEPKPFVAGQFLTVVMSIEGQEVRRAYSYCSDPAQPERFAITVKRVAGGLVSNHINDQADVGWRLRVLGPSGRFGDALPGDAGADQEVVLVAGGVGCTPLLSMAYAQLASAPEVPLHFLYANRSRRDALFLPALRALAQQYPTMRLHHVLEDATGMAEDPGLLDDGRETWSEGRLEGDGLAPLPRSSHAHYFLCGPVGMMENARHYLREGHVPEAQIIQETFVDQSGQQQSDATGAVYAVRMQRAGMPDAPADEQATLHVSDSKTLLAAGLEAGWPMDYSCQMGGCAACRVKVISGSVAMPEPHCLTPEERAEGYCLACIAQPRSDLVIDVE